MTTEKLEACVITSLIAIIVVFVTILLAGCTQTTRIKGIDIVSPVGLEIILDFTLK